MNLVLDSTVLVDEIIGKGTIWLFILESQHVGTAYIMAKQCYVAEHWKCTSFSVFTHATSQCNGRKQTSWLTSSKKLDRNSIHSVFHRLYWWNLSFTKYMIASQLILMFCINLNLIYILCWGGLKIDFGFVISILCFRQSPQHGSLRPLHCDVECSDFLPVLLVSDLVFAVIGANQTSNA